jgi:hypothetical protein
MDTRTIPVQAIAMAMGTRTQSAKLVTIQIEH